MTYGEEVKEEGRREGRQQGLQQGLQDGARAMLRSILETKFGPLDDVTNARLDTAGTDTLQQWAHRILVAAALDEVFDG